MSNTSRPIVGITATSAPIHETGDAGVASTRVVAAYVETIYLDAVRGAGMVPIVLPPNDPAVAADVVTSIDALLITGGEDIHPSFYDEAPHPAAGPFVPTRDAWEIALVHAARARRVPVLGICRGMQLLNVALGGSLVQHLAEGDEVRGARHDRGSERTSRVHAVTLAPGPLATVLGTLALASNSYHHQAVARVAAGLSAAAWADDSVIEAITSTDATWRAFGVQWHPEELVDDAEPWDRALFAWMASQAKSGRDTAVVKRRS